MEQLQAYSSPPRRPMSNMNKEETVVSQPRPVQGMVVPQSGGNRNVKNLPLDNEGKRDWSFGLFDCFDDAATCCMAMWCPCIIHAQNRRRLDHLNNQGIPDPDRNEICTSDGWTYFCVQALCDVGWVMQIGTRAAIRQRYNIRGGGGDDCFAALCCGPCELTQDSRELELEESTFAPAQPQAK
ncbi:hypothetical protein AX17_001965 [Amanita inopinata Kibby_2008]|nr:hypothetical protein AX17_001965 [Amanita inopinata Kibby_2008]